MYDFTQITEVKLASGSHSSPAEGMCFMEMTAWFAGEAHSDKPACACPVLGAYGIRLNDSMSDSERDRLLKPLVPLIAGTRGTRKDELARVNFLTIWTINKILPIALRSIKLEKEALACEAATDLASAHAAADAAYAAAAAAAYAAKAAYAACEEVMQLMVEGLRQAILIGPHEGFDLAIDLQARHAALRELVAAA